MIRAIVRIGGDVQDRRPLIIGHGDGPVERQRLDRRPGHGHARLIGDPHDDVLARLQHDPDGLRRRRLRAARDQTDRSLAGCGLPCRPGERSPSSKGLGTAEIEPAALIRDGEWLAVA